jgi:hypothetical protein
MTYDRWYEDYDWSVFFPHSFEEAGIYYTCDDEDFCTTFYEETEEVCTYEGDCFTVDGALEYYFEGDMEDYEVPDSDAFHNFMATGGIDNFLPFEHQDSTGTYWKCDSLEEEYRWCVKIDEQTQEVCSTDDECFSMEEFIYDFGDWWMYEELDF